MLERYLAGDCSAVWDDLTALGAAGSHELYRADAEAVARETMRRARRNVETILKRLDQLGYQFLDLEGERGDTADQREQDFEKVGTGRRASRVSKKAAIKNPNVYAPPDKNTPKLLSRIEKKTRGPMPLSLRTWYEEVGAVCFMGTHPALNPEGLDVTPDPLVMAPLKVVVDWLGEQEEMDGGYLFHVSPDELHKANISGGDPYSMRLPDKSADAILLYTANETTFVQYLRRSFAWGGFPGWEGSGKAPTEQINFLREGLLPI